MIKNAMAAVDRSPSWTTSSVVELLRRKELALLCQLASSAEAKLRQRLFSIDSQIVWDCWSESRPLSKGSTKCSQFWQVHTREAQHSHALALCTVAHTTFYRVLREELFPVSPRWLSVKRRWDLTVVMHVHPFPQTTMSSVRNTGSRLIISGADMLPKPRFWC